MYETIINRLPFLRTRLERSIQEKRLNAEIPRINVIDSFGCLGPIVGFTTIVSAGITLLITRDLTISVLSATVADMVVLKGLVDTRPRITQHGDRLKISESDIN